MIIKYLLIILLLLSTANADKKIKTSLKKDKNYLYIYMQNKHMFDLTMKLDANIIFPNKSVKRSKIISLRANTKIKVLKIKRLSRRFKYNSKYKWTLGNLNSKHDNKYLYRLPYALNTKQMVSQGFNGSFTHFKQSQYAIDFALKPNTAIYAARGGRVVKVKEDSKYGGNNKKFLKYANQITIKHNDGTYAAYAHLRYKGSIVKKGDFIQRGDLIGYSGSTGYVSGPHLHLVVFKAKSFDKRESLPIKFISKKGIINNPKINQYYISRP